MIRPWGSLQWMIGKYPINGFSYLGSLGTEVRTLSAWRVSVTQGCIADTTLLRIRDLPTRLLSTTSVSQACEAKLDERLKEYVAEGGDPANVEDHTLLESHEEIITSVDAFAARCTKKVLLDVTTLPKRFFFPIIKRLLHDVSIQDILVTYTCPAGRPNEPLASNHNDWAHLPLFSGDFTTDPIQQLVVGVGFEALGLPEQVDSASGLPAKLLLPFPAPPSSFHRSWELIRKLQEHRAPESISIYRVDSKDISDTFDRLVTLSNHGTIRTELAPFGPKPVSVAMCLFAILSGSPVSYTQPTVYHPDYSIGVSHVDGFAEIYAHCIRMDGRDLYVL